MLIFWTLQYIPLDKVTNKEGIQQTKISEAASS